MSCERVFVFGPQIAAPLDPVMARAVLAEPVLDAWCAESEYAVAVQRFASGWALDAADVRVPWLQSAVTATQLAITGALARRGVYPAAVAGLSMGELAAAIIARGLDVFSATRIASGVGAMFARCAGDGAMAAVAIRHDVLAHFLAGTGATVAVTLSPEIQVIAGTHADLARVVRLLAHAGICVRPLHLPDAFHTPQVASLRATFLGALPPDGRSRTLSLPFYSGLGASPTDNEYWWRVCSEPFHFDDAIRAALADGARYFLEIGTRPVVAEHIVATARDLGISVVVESCRDVLGAT